MKSSGRPKKIMDSSIPWRNAVSLVKFGAPRRARQEREDAQVTARRVKFHLHSTAHAEDSVRDAVDGGGRREERQHLRGHEQVTGAVVLDARESASSL